MIENRHKFEKEDLLETDETKAANELLSRAADMIKPYSRSHIGSFALHFYAGTDVVTGKNELLIGSQRVDWEMSTEAAGVYLEEVRDRVLEMLGATKQKLGPQTVEEAKDLGNLDAH